MKFTTLYKLLFVALVLLTSACSKDFLEVNPIGKASSDDFLKNEDEAFMAIIGVYDLMQYNYNTPWNSVFFIKNLPADDVNCAGGNDGDQPPYQQLDDFSFVSDNPAITSMWSYFYKAISSANTIIERVDANEAALVPILAEAKALRAFNYFELVSIFGDVPLMTVNPLTTDEYHKARTPKAEVYAQIEADLTEAIPNLPWKSELSTEQKFRFSKGAALATLGKVYLYQKKYDEAASTFETLISSGEYGLVADFAKIWDKEEELGIESVFEIMFTDEEGYDWGNFPWGGRPESNIHAQLMGPRGDGIFDLTGTGLINGWGFNLPTAKIADAFNAAGDVVRRKASIMSESELIAAGGAVSNPSTIHDYEGYIRIKYATKTSETNTNDGVISELNYTTNWRLIRYADVLLMAAEANALKSTPDATKASSYLRMVRQRAGLTLATDLSGAALFQAIVNERELELAFEGHRYFDLVRWGLANQELASSGFISGKHELFPIPFNEISGNNAISDADQNPGY